MNITWYFNTELQPIDVEIKNLESLISDIQRIRNEFDSIIKQCEFAATEIQLMEPALPSKRKRNNYKIRTEDESVTAEEIQFIVGTCNVI